MLQKHNVYFLIFQLPVLGAMFNSSAVVAVQRAAGGQATSGASPEGQSQRNTTFKAVQLHANGDLGRPSASGPSSELLAGRTIWHRLSSVLAHAFLPSGYPDSVTSDYLQYQIWDTVQAACSYVRGMLTAQALLTGIGVGDSSATAASAVLQFFFKDAVGLLAGVIFAAIEGSSFDAHAKQWRLAADVANDVGLAVELAAPAWPSCFLAMLCFGSVCRAVTGVAGGATRMALTQHFALKKNAADIASKEASQETAVTLIGMILGVGLTRLAAVSHVAAWAAFWVLTAVHIAANIAALRCLHLNRLNASRLDIILQQHMVVGRVPSPAVVARRESLVASPIQRALQRLGLANNRIELLLAPHLEQLSRGARQAAAQALAAPAKQGAPEAVAQGRYCAVPAPHNGAMLCLLGDIRTDDELLEAYCVTRLMAWQVEGIDGGVDDAYGWAERGGCTAFLNAARQAGWACEIPALGQGGSRLSWGKRTKAS